MKYLARFLVFLLLFFLSSPATAISTDYQKITFTTSCTTPPCTLQNDRKNFPLGETTFGNIPFSIKTTSPNYLNSQSSNWQGNPTSLLMSNVNINKPLTAYVLVAAGGCSIQTYDNDKIGQIKFTFSDNQTYTYDLSCRKNLREWISSNPGFIHNTTDSNVTNVWTGLHPSQEGQTIVDMISIDFPSSFANKYLKDILVEDTSLLLNKPYDPAIHFIGITIKYNTEIDLFPIVFLPGHGGSWNWEGLIGDNDPATSEWTLAAWAKDYSNFLATLRNSGYTEQNKKLYVFNYNWRKPLDTRADRLNEYINNVVLADHPAAKIKLIGHSLGGLVARGYAQKYGTASIDRLITVGSPHEGAVDSYYAVSGGEIKKDNLLQRLAFELLLKTHQHSYTTNRDLVINEAPSSLDLLPIFDYLKKSGQNLSWQNMNAKNNWLRNLKDALDTTLNGILTTVKGANFTTLRELTVSDATWEERAKGLWLDGKPTGTIANADGDGTVLGTSAGLGTQETLNYTHGELISSSEGITKLLQLLDVSGTPVTTNSPLQNILVFILRSPATINIYDSQGKTPPGLNLVNGKLAILENPNSGDYQVQVKGTSQGNYSLDVGALTNTQDFWQEIKRPTDTQKRDNFTINYSKTDPESTMIKDPTGLNNIRLAKEKLVNLRSGTNGQTYRYLYEASRQLERAETLLVRKTPVRAYQEQALPFLESANEYLYRAYGEITAKDKLTTLEAAAHLIMLSYQTVAAAANKISTQTVSQAGLTAAQTAITLADAAAAATPPTGDKLTRSANLFSKAKEIYASAQTNHQNSKYAYAKLKAVGAKLLAEKTKSVIVQ